MRKSKVPKAEIEICKRLRFAREKVLKITQAECARQIGLDRSTFSNYETARTPLRHEIALRFCRQFIISEEWLATGYYDAARTAIIARGVPGQGTDNDRVDFILIRQCMDLLSEPATLQINPGALFSVAFDGGLKTRYAELAQENPWNPRINFSDADQYELAVTFLRVIHERHCAILCDEAQRRGVKSALLWRAYLRQTYLCAYHICRRISISEFPGEVLASPDFVRAVICEAFPRSTEAGDDPKKDLIGSSLKSNCDTVKSEIEELIARVKRHASRPGAKAELARTLGVAPARISEWLSDEKEPGGEYTLRLLRWVEQQERQK